MALRLQVGSAPVGTGVKGSKKLYYAVSKSTGFTDIRRLCKLVAAKVRYRVRM